MSGPTRKADFTDLAGDPSPAHIARETDLSPPPAAGSARFGETMSASVEIGQVRMVHGAAAMLALSVLADSGIEHSPGQYHNPAMFTPLVSASLSIFARAIAVQAGSYAS